MVRPEATRIGSLARPGRRTTSSQREQHARYMSVHTYGGQSQVPHRSHARKRVPTLPLCFSPAAAFPQEIDPARHTIHACAHRHTSRSIASPTTATNRRAAPPHLACITPGSSSLASCSDPILMVTGVIRDTHLSRQKRAATRSKRLKSSSRNLQSVC